MTHADKLLDALRAALTVPVRAPGSAPGALPAVVVRAAAPRVSNNRRILEHRYDVACVVPRDGAVDNLARLEVLHTDTYRALVDAGYLVDDYHRDDQGGDGDTAWLAFIIPVTSPEVFC